MVRVLTNGIILGARVLIVTGCSLEENDLPRGQENIVKVCPCGTRAGVEGNMDIVPPCVGIASKEAGCRVGADHTVHAKNEKVIHVSLHLP